MIIIRNRCDSIEGVFPAGIPLRSAIMIHKSIFSLEFDPEDNPDALDIRKHQIKLEINVDHGIYDDPMNDHVI